MDLQKLKDGLVHAADGVAKNDRGMLEAGLKYAAAACVAPDPAPAPPADPPADPPSA